VESNIGASARAYEGSTSNSDVDTPVADFPGVDDASICMFPRRYKPRERNLPNVTVVNDARSVGL